MPLLPLLPLLLLFLPLSLPAAAAALERPGAIRGAAAARLNRLAEDPLADEDSFARLAEADKRRWAQGAAEEAGLAAKMRRLGEVEVVTRVHVRLVGFDGDGDDNRKLNVKAEEMTKFLNTLKPDNVFRAIHGESHGLAIRQRVAFSVSKAPRRLASAVSGDIFRFVGRAMARAKEGEVVLLPHALVDAHIRNDAAMLTDSAAGSGGGEGGKQPYAVYVLNPRMMPRRYAYSYGSVSDTVCPGTSFQDERYLWVDLTAGPVSYGPVWEGEGAVTAAAYLRAEDYSNDLLHGAFLAHVAALIDSATRHVFVPPLLHVPVTYAVTTDIWLIAMRSGVGDGEAGGGEDMGLSLGAIKDELLSRWPAVVLAGQQVRFKEVVLSLAHCSFCSTALHRAMRSGLFEATTASTGAAPSSAAGMPGGTEVWRHVDSEDLHHYLSEFWPEITDLAGMPNPDYVERNDPNPHAGRFFPVFLFDLHTAEPLLLDGRHRALAYDDMVLAVRTKAPPMLAEYRCEGELVPMDPSNVTRAVLSAILQTAWGVAPTHESWSAIHNVSRHNWRWSVGMTPFGPFSRHTSLSMAHRDAALRNVVLSVLNTTISSTLHLLTAMQKYGSEEAALRPGALRQHFSQRWAVLLHKIDRAAAALSDLDFPLAGYFARSARHDMDALFDIAGQSAQEMHTSFACFQEAPVSWSFWGSAAVLSYLAFIVARSRLRVWRVKHKRF
ncbi:hypothetical protein CLOM_g6435 [Closterium sp. NIES-68]|nr:hypothetical protein CLOM_g6435 [Closterium sp. NIES-68]GJP83984.1 hypothetical protein CLOP_g14082 [Closterium sp. NIES-67]